MKPKYSIGDHVLVVHRKDGNCYYSYTLDGSTGIIDEITEMHSGAYACHLRHDDTVDAIVFAHGEDYDPAIVKNAWYEECCLDPAPLPDTVEFKDFESVLG